ncbi:nuclease-related domain-containing protein [Alkalihalobacillus sp. 1P02AB]|uniref:nuclease-related domain-containing protein n=1 Tax=Alkalihalobacillus sp. 1P02AB TaxID=3132260 RepID=UPI0039A4C539
MILKQRKEPSELLLQRVLSLRLKSFSSKDRRRLFKLEKVFSGEQAFDHWAVQLPKDWIQIHDLWLQKDDSPFQIDSLIISSTYLFLFEVKNYEGDYEYKDHRFYSLNSSEIKNPLNQLERNESLLRQWFQLHKIQHPQITSFIIFINPNFYLFLPRPKSPTFVFPNQLNRFLEKLTQQTGSINQSHKNIASQLISSQLSESPFFKQPSFKEREYKSGLYCKYCFSFNLSPLGRTTKCRNCFKTEKLHQSITRSIQDYQILFPNSFITTNKIYDWCGIPTINKRSIGRILTNNYKRIGQTKGAYYI